MSRLTDAVLLCAAAFGAVWTYQIKHEADLSAKHITSLNAQIRAQNRKIALLEADWAIGIGPARLEKVAGQFKDQLKLRPMESSQIVSVDELPGFRADEAKPEDDEIFAGNGGSMTTGGIGALIKEVAPKEEGQN